MPEVAGADGTVVEIGESSVGAEPDAAAVTVLLGSRDGPVGVAWASALAAPAPGRDGFLVVLQPGLPVKPFTLLVPAEPVEGRHVRRLLRGPVQAGVAAGVADAVAAAVVAEEDAEQLLAVVTASVDPDASDPDALFANHREAVRAALVIARAGLPAARDAVSKRADAWNDDYRPTGDESG